jgi:hypothetical protein
MSTLGRGSSGAVAVLALAAVAVAVFAHPADAAIAVTQRDSILTLSFADQNAFSDASLGTRTTLGLFGGAPDTRNFGWITPTGTSNFQVVSNTLDFGVSAPVLVPGSPNSIENFTVGANAALPTAGSIVVSGDLAVNVALSGADSSISTGIANNHRYLDEIYDPVANQAIGAPFSVTVLIPGDYSQAGTATGNHQLLSLGAAWTIDKNFVYNGTNTTFAAHIDNYQGSAVTPVNLEYQIFGAPVPEPSTYALLLAGLGLLGLVMRHKKHQPA